jgi:hypothetical protein
LEYWIASSDPARDEHIRKRALRETGEQSWAALRLLVSEEWQQAISDEVEEVA